MSEHECQGCKELAAKVEALWTYMEWALTVHRDTEAEEGLHRWSALKAAAMKAPPPPRPVTPDQVIVTDNPHVPAATGAGDGLEQEATRFVRAIPAHRSRAYNPDDQLEYTESSVRDGLIVFARSVRDAATAALLDKIAKLEAPLAVVTQERDELRERLRAAAEAAKGAKT